MFSQEGKWRSPRPLSARQKKEGEALEKKGFFHCVLKELTKKDKGKDLGQGGQKSRLSDCQMQGPEGWDPGNTGLSASAFYLFKARITSSVCWGDRCGPTLQVSSDGHLSTIPLLPSGLQSAGCER